MNDYDISPKTLGGISKALKSYEKGKIVFTESSKLKKLIENNIVIKLISKCKKPEELFLYLDTPIIGIASVVAYNYNTKIPPVFWKVGFSNNFWKDIKKVDKKISGKLWKAVELITRNPLRPIGNTLKPLSDNLAGLWSYRLSNYRLIYKPFKEERIVFFVVLEHREKAYN